jgi:hypothetical protein
MTIVAVVITNTVQGLVAQVALTKAVEVGVVAMEW